MLGFWALTTGAITHAQTAFNESFTGTTADGWVFGGNYTPNLTATTIDTPGNGWLRLTDNNNNRSTFALLDTQIFSVNAKIEITMDYAFWNGTGADGITFFLVDGSETSFSAGAFGGSLGYAQKDATAAPPSGVAGMPGGYLGFGLDNFGNYSNPTEGRVGGPGSRPNAIAVRGPESSNFAYINGTTLDTYGDMDFQGYTTRPNQTGADYRSFKIILDANNQLEVLMKFGASSNYDSVFTADLSGYERPETFKIGFTGATGGNTEIHEVRNVSLVSTPWSTGDGAYEWDNGAGSTAWGNTPAGGNNNWFAAGTANNKTPTAKSDVLFGNKPTNNGTNNTQQVDLSANVAVRNLTFDSGINYSIGSADDGRTITFGKDADGVGLPSINVNDYNGAYAQHKINSKISLAENIAIRNFSYSTLCLNGEFATNGKAITTSGYGGTNFNGQITGSGDLVVNGSSTANVAAGQGIVTISGNNTTWSGDITVNGGQLVVLSNNALGLTGDAVNRKINTNAASGTSTIRLTNANAAGLVVGQEVTATNIPPGTVITNIAVSGSNTTLTLSAPNTGAISNGTSINFAYGNTVVNSGGTLTFRGGTATAEKLTINGTGAAIGMNKFAGAIYNDGGDNTLSGTIALGSDSAISSRAGNLTLSGVISGSGRSLTKTGDGGVTLTGTNTYSGATIVQGGALRVTTANALSSNSNLQLNGGVLEIGADINGGTAGDYSPTIGTGATNIQWTGDGGFSAFGGARTVTLAGGTLTWGSGSFVPTGNALLLSSNYADNTLTFTNAIAFGSAQREVRVADGSAAVDGILSGNLTGNGGLIKTGEGTLALSGTNTYSGATEIRAGALRISNTNSFSNNSNLQLNGGVLEIGTDLNGGTAGDYSQRLGTGGTQLAWTGSGGFSAATADRTVSLTNSGGTANGTLTWNAGNFVSNGNALILGSNGSDKTLTLTNALDLGSSVRDIRVVQGTNTAIANGVLSGAIANTPGGLAITGNGRLDLTAANLYTGTTTITGSEVRLTGAAGAIASSSAITVKQGGTLTLDNAASLNANRVGNTTGVTLNGGTLNFLGAASASSETIGTVTLAGGANTINVQRNGSNSAVLTAAGIVIAADATVNLTNAAGGGTLGAGGNNPGFVISGYPATPGVAYGYATVNSSAFVTLGSNGVTALATTNTTQSAWNNTIHAATTADQTLDGDRTVGSLILGNGIDVKQTGNRTLTIQSGGLLATGAIGSTISASTLNAGSDASNLYTHVYGNGGLTISSSITNNSGAKGFVKSGDGTLTFSGTTANTYTGTTTVNDGTLVLAKSAGTTAVAGNLVIGDGRGIDTVRLDANEQIADNASVTLRGGELGNAANVARLEMNGATSDSYGSRIEHFASLNIEGNTVLDFGGGTPCSPTFLYLDFLNVAANSLLTVSNWIEFTDFLLVKKTTFDSTQLSRVIFDGYGGAASWKDYDSGYYQIIPFAPVPEPATYGLLSFGAIIGLVVSRRRRRASVAV